MNDAYEKAMYTKVAGGTYVVAGRLMSVCGIKVLPPDTPWTLFRALLAPPQNGERAGFDSPPRIGA